MADFRAIAAVTEAVLQVLRSNASVDDFGQELDFKVFTARDFANPLSAGVSLFLYRVVPCGVQRNAPAPLAPDGTRAETLLPLELHFMLTVWGGEASLQHAIAGWMMRIIEDQPIFPSALLNAVIPGSFRPNETVEVCLAELSNEDLLRMWETLVQNVYQLSVPYLARILRIEPVRRVQSGEGIVLERLLRAAVLEDEEALR
jgi:hypothetical protein